ncbi:RIMS-binding protein 2 isoform X4 [Ambystoma mexicanum]|uniref:RIMS-binding protein 2 isoform X4 n=1 Tax=Ambystoma mexicanum TaxID=8296 RepID=UPI0037E99A36
MGQCACGSEHRIKDKTGDHDFTRHKPTELPRPISKVGTGGGKEQEEKEAPPRAENSELRSTSLKPPNQRPTTKPPEKHGPPAATKKNKDPTSSTTSKKTSARPKMHPVNGEAPQLQGGCKEPPSGKDMEIKELQTECEELRNRLEGLREGLTGQRPSDVEQLLKQSQKELLWLQRQLSFISPGASKCIFSSDKLRNGNPWQPAEAQKSLDGTPYLEARAALLQPDAPWYGHGRPHCTLQDYELKDSVRERNRLSLQYASLSRRALQYDQVKSDYDQLKETLVIVTKERNLAVKEKYQLEAKLENLEQVLKHMREAAERRQQLEVEHEQALAVLTAKQQEIEVLQKAQVEAKKEHEGAVQLLENTLDSMQAKVRELEEKCRMQSQQFNLLSKELEKFRQQTGTIDLLSGTSLSSADALGSPGKALSQFMNGIATPIGKGHESPSGTRPVISEFIRPLQVSAEKPEQLSVRPTFLTRSRAGSPRNRLEGDMDNEPSTNTSKQRYTGRVHLCIARYSYNPFDGPNENPEAELPLTCGKYLYVYGDMDEDGFYEGELLDGQRGLVPSNFVDFVQNEDLHVSSSLGSEQDQNCINHASLGSQDETILEAKPPNFLETSAVNNGSGTLDMNIDEIGEDIVPYPRKITLIKQLAKSVIVGWEPPVVPPGWGAVKSYNVLVDKEMRMSVDVGGRTKALIEKLNLATSTCRISIQSVTERGLSDHLQCSLLVGKDVIVAPSQLKMDNVTQSSAELSWVPTNSNYSHVIFLNDEEFDIVKAGCYRYQFLNLKPGGVYKLKLLAKPHQMPWQLPLEQREKKEAFIEFSTLPAGPPSPPQDVSIHARSTPVTVLVSWRPPLLSPTGTSNGASVIGYGVYAKGQRVAEVIFPTAENVVVDLGRIQNLEAREITVRTLSAQGESEDSSHAPIPPDLLVPPAPQPRTAPQCKPPVQNTKEDHLGPHRRLEEPWDHTRPISPQHGHNLEPPHSNYHSPNHGRRSPSPQRILPQPQGTPVSNTVAKAMAREAAQRMSESNRMERRSIFSERSSVVHYANSDEEEEEEDEEDGYDSPHTKRKGTSVDDFLKGSELGKQPHYSQGDDYQTESSRGSDLSDIMEEDEEDLYTEMQLEDGGRRRISVTSHNTLKDYTRNRINEAGFTEEPEFPNASHHSKKLFSIPEVAEDDGEYAELSQRGGLGVSYKMRRAGALGHRVPGVDLNQDGRQHGFRVPAKHRSPGTSSGLNDLEGRGNKFTRSLTRSPDSGLDCGSEEEESRFNFRNAFSSMPTKDTQIFDPETSSCPSRRSSRQTLARKRTLTRQSSIEEDFEDLMPCVAENSAMHGFEDRRDDLRDGEIQVSWKSECQVPESREAVPASKPPQTEPLLLGPPSSGGRMDRGEHPNRRVSHGNALPTRPRPMSVPSIEITVDSSSEGAHSRSGSEGNLSPVQEDSKYHCTAGPQGCSLRCSGATDHRHDGYCGQQQLSPEIFEESETDAGTEDSVRIFVALFDYDPRTMSPNPDAAEEEVGFKEGQIIKIYGDKDSDGFYRGETCGRAGFIPCNMVSEIQADDEMVDQLLKQGFLPLNTPIEKLERNRRSGRQHSVSTRRMVALYDYDPRESSPNVDVQAELTFCTGDIITVFGEIDDDGFYYGEHNGQKGLVPSNFLEEVPDDVEVYLSDAPTRYAQDAPVRTKPKRVPSENAGTRRAASPTVHLHSASPPSSLGSGSPVRGREMSSKKMGLLSKGKKLLKKLGAVK